MEFDCKETFNNYLSILRITLSKAGTMLAMLRMVKASPGWKPRVTEGHTRESAQANTMNCMPQKTQTNCMSKKNYHFVEQDINGLFYFSYLIF